MTEIDELFQACLEKNFPFAAFQFPGENTYQYTIQLSPAKTINSISDISNLSGFVFAPFQEKSYCPSLIITPDITGKQYDSIKNHLEIIKGSNAVEFSYNGLKSVHEATQTEYMNNVAKVRDKIRKGKFRKAILSRAIVQKNNVKLTDIFLMMCQKYHYSFISIVNIPGLGCWIGASPELLFKKHHNEITLVALAGTQARTNENVSETKWDAKEIIEQTIVADYLKKLLNDFDIKHYEQIGPETVEAGDVLHIKTEFTIPEASLLEHTGDFIKQLHPTPAVWGQPKTEALDIIKVMEGYDREYYAGFLGPIVQNGEMDLYVNLRTMKAIDNKLMIYVGSGITEDSVPKKEWEETCMKAMTLQSIINQQ